MENQCYFCLFRYIPFSLLALKKMDAKDTECLVEEREDMLMKFDGSDQSVRKGLFLRSNQYISQRDLGVPFFPHMHRPCSDWVSKLASVSFKGWPYPRSHWQQWVEKLRPVYEDVWKKAGIFEAIQVSTCKIRRDLTSMWEVLPYWSYETNTFIFPFGEASITLEDTMILGGFSPTGLCVRGASLNEELEKLNLQLLCELRSFNKTKAKKACFSAWMNHFMNCNDLSVEHIAFLSLWLSRYVFLKAPAYVIQQELFPIAILLAQGERFALGPAVLASLYHDMRLLKEHLASSNKNEVLTVFAPFQLVQMWVWEHFVSVRQNACPKFVDHGKPWATRWHEVSIKRIPYSRFVCQSPHNFQWRPYAKKLDNWSPPACYGENGQWICGNDVNDQSTVSFAQCLRSCELVGLDSIQLYLPQRVSRLFGYDQDLMGCAHINARVSDWELAWANYKKHETNYMLYVPPQDFESDVTYQYCSWWKENISSSSYFWADIGTLEKHLERKRKRISIDLGSGEQTLQVDSNTTPPFELNDLLIELDELPRCNVIIIKGIARVRGSLSRAAFSKNQLAHRGNEEANLAAAGGEKRHDVLHGSKNIEHEALDYGENLQNCSLFSLFFDIFLVKFPLLY